MGPSAQALSERPDPGNEAFEERGRVDGNPDERVGFSTPMAAPVGDGHATGQRSGQFDVDRGWTVLHEIGIQCDSGGQRVVQMRQEAGLPEPEWIDGLGAQWKPATIERWAATTHRWGAPRWRKRPDESDVAYEFRCRPMSDR